jgi:hypothetical protein
MNGGRELLQIIELFSLVSDVFEVGTTLINFLTSDENFKLGIVVVGLIKPKKEEPPSLPTR